MVFSRLITFFLSLTLSRQQILRAVAVKLDLAPEVDLLEWAKTTEDYSGADLQAVLYNAHLNAIHEGIDVERLTAADKENKSPEADGDDQRLEFSVAVASRNSKSQMPRMTAAERGYLENRVGLFRRLATLVPLLT